MAGNSTAGVVPTGIIFAASLLLPPVTYCYLYFPHAFESWEPASLKYIDENPAILEVFLIIFGAVFMLAVANLAKTSRTIQFFHGMTVLLMTASVVLFYAVYYRSYGICDLSCKPSLSHDSDTALYFSIATWTTLGYGDVTPGPGMRLIAASEACFGLLSGAIIVGAVVNFFRLDHPASVMPTPADTTNDSSTVTKRQG